jgi:hypothetical protein
MLQTVAEPGPGRVATNRMTRPRLPLLVAALCLAASGASAQNFFERLFGLTPSRPEPPPVQRQAPQAPPPEGLGDDNARKAALPPAPAKPVAIRAPSEDTVVGRELKQNGATGSLRIERTGTSDYRVRLTLLGRRAADSPETCPITFGDSGSVPLVYQGRPEGMQRFQLADPTCPMQFDLLDEAVLVKGPESGMCVFQALNCQADPSGMWGPEPAALIPRARDFESIRASADKAARDNYKVLTQRASPQAVRPIVAEQAAFSADREQVCRSYVREGTHGFCNARFSEGRALSLGTRLGLTPGATAAIDPPVQRARRSRPLDSDDPYSLPSSDQLLAPQR